MNPIIQKIIRNINNLKNGKLPTIRLRPDDVASVQDFYDSLSMPKFASSQELINLFAKIMMHNIVIKSQNDTERKTIMINISKHLSKRIYACLLPDILDKVVDNYIFFPAPCEFIKIHNEIKSEKQWDIEKVMAICKKSLEYYNETLKDASRNGKEV